jgi:hypothetical protein
MLIANKLPKGWILVHEVGHTRHSRISEFKERIKNCKTLGDSKVKIVKANDVGAKFSTETNTLKFDMTGIYVLIKKI